MTTIHKFGTCEQIRVWEPCENEALPSTVIMRSGKCTRICGPCLESRLAERSVQPSRPPDSPSCKMCSGLLSTCSHCHPRLSPPDRRRSGLRFVDCLAGIIALEQGELTDEDDVYALFQGLIDTGLAWTLQGCYGRAAADMIRSGECFDTHGVLNRERSLGR